MRFNWTQGQTAWDLRKMKEALWRDLELLWAWRAPCQQGELADQWHIHKLQPCLTLFPFRAYRPLLHRCLTRLTEISPADPNLAPCREGSSEKCSPAYILRILQLRVLDYLFTGNLRVRKKQGRLLPQRNDSLAFRSIAINWVSQGKSEGNRWVGRVGWSHPFLDGTDKLYAVRWLSSKHLWALQVKGASGHVHYVVRSIWGMKTLFWGPQLYLCLFTTLRAFLAF